MFSLRLTDVGESRMFTSALAVRILNPSPSLQTLEASVLLTSTPMRPAGGAGRDSGIPGMQHSWYSVCITPTLSSLPEILHLYHWIYVCVERLCCIYVEGCKNSFRSRLLEIQRNKSHFLFITAYSNWGGGSFALPILENPRESKSHEENMQTPQ